MTTGPALPGDDPRRLLSGARELAQRVRRAQRATWFPLLVFAAVTFASIRVYRYGGLHLGNCVVTGPGLRTCTACIRRSRAQGVETRVRPYAVAGIIIAAALTGAAVWLLHHPSASGPVGLGGLALRLSAPAAAIGVAMLVLARAERNRALLLLTLGYLAVGLIPVSFGWVTSTPQHQSRLPDA